MILQNLTPEENIHPCRRKVSQVLVLRPDGRLVRVLQDDLLHEMAKNPRIRPWPILLPVKAAAVPLEMWPGLPGADSGGAKVECILSDLIPGWWSYVLSSGSDPDP